jgi:hypothetical protein
LSAPAPIVVTALFAGEDQAWFEAQRRRHYPPERNRVPAHLTLFHHLPPGIAEELAHRLAVETRGLTPPAARIAGVVSLGSGVAYRIESDGLLTLRERLAEAFAGLLIPQDAAGWRPHVTIQNKVSPGEASTLLAHLRADFRPRAVAIAALAAWWYRDGCWEPLSRHKFA